VLAHGFGPDATTPDYTILQGDLTAAYSRKARQVTRSFVFLNLRHPQVPAALVVFDRVISAQPGFRKFWLLHTQEEPRLERGSAVVDCTEHDQRGRLTLDVLLPRTVDQQLATIGGPGKESWVFGTNYANDIESAQRERGSPEPGAWRIELSPKAVAAEDLFLTVMQVTDRTAPIRFPARLIELPDRVGAYLQRQGGDRLVLFRRDGARAAQPVIVELSGPGTAGVLVCDLVPGTWRVRRAGATIPREIRVSEELGAAWFEAAPGTWQVELTNP